MAFLGFWAPGISYAARGSIDRYYPPSEHQTIRVASARPDRYYPPPVRTQNQEVEVFDPVIDSLSPDSADWKSASLTVTVNGSDFVPGSVAKINGENRHTTFIDSEHLLVNLSAYDMNQSGGGFYLTVWNPNGKYSNAGYFTLKGSPAAPANSENPVEVTRAYNRDYNYNYSFDSTRNRTSQVSGQSLAGSVILGGGTFLPNGLVQWVIVAIIVVAIIILIRKAFGARDNYDNTPLKHA